MVELRRTLRECQSPFILQSQKKRMITHPLAVEQSDPLLAKQVLSQLSYNPIR